MVLRSFVGSASITYLRKISLFRGYGRQPSRYCSVVPSLPPGVHQLRLPSLMDTNIGTIDKWLKKEGDFFRAGEALCVVSIGDLTVGINVPTEGYLTRILHHAGLTELKSGEPIAIYADDKETMMEYMDQERLLTADLAKLADVGSLLEEKAKQPDTADLLRYIRHLITEGDIRDKDYSKRLLSLARQGDKELMAVFEASFEEKDFSFSSIDKKFFLENSKDIVEEHAMKEQLSKSSSEKHEG